MRSDTVAVYERPQPPYKIARGVAFRALSAPARSSDFAVGDFPGGSELTGEVLGKLWKELLEGGELRVHPGVQDGAAHPGRIGVSRDQLAVDIPRDREVEGRGDWGDRPGSRGSGYRAGRGWFTRSRTAVKEADCAAKAAGIEGGYPE